MFQDESWKPIYFGVIRSKVKVVSHKNIAGVGFCTLVGTSSVRLTVRMNALFDTFESLHHAARPPYRQVPILLIG